MPTTRESSPRPASRLAPLVVWGVLLGLLAMDLRHVDRYSSPYPRWDDLDWVHALCPDLELSPRWLWSSWNEHRLPLPRLIGVAVVRAANDLRAALYFDLALMAAMSAAMIATLRRLRGSTRIVDAVFPLLMLSPGAGALFLVLQNITYIVPLALLVAILVLIGIRRGAPGARRSLAIGVCTCALPLCGGPGLATAPVLLLWMMWLGSKLERSAAPDRAARNILWGSCAATVIVLGLYFIGFERVAEGTWNSSLTHFVAHSFRFLAMGLGPAAEIAWPWSGFAACAMGLTASVVLARTWRREPLERDRVVGIAAVSIAATCMAVAIAQLRGEGFEARYVPLAVLWWFCTLFACLLYAPRISGRCVGWGTIVLLLVFFPENSKFLREEGERHSEVTDSFSVDLSHGLEIEELARRYPSCFWRDAGVQYFRERLVTMHEFGMWPTLVDYAKQRAAGIACHRVSPLRIESRKDVAYRWLNGKFVLIGPADFALYCARIPNTTRFEGRFGVHPATYEKQPAHSWRFTIEATRAGNAPELLFDRTLQAGSLEADRGFQKFSVMLPDDSQAAELILRVVRQGPATDDPSYVFWTDLRAQ